MRLKELANKYQLSLESIQHFIHDFGIDLNFCFTDQFVVSEAFDAFVEKHLAFIRLYAEDKAKIKSISEIAQEIKVPAATVEAFFQQNGVADADLAKVRTNISSYQIHLMLGGDYEFIFEDIPERRSGEDPLLGYADLFFYCLDLLEPFINEDQIKLWGISKPAGIVLYGPPGAGKIFWAKRIAGMIGYEFVHVYKDYLLNTAGNEALPFYQFLRQQLERPKTLLFIERFEELWEQKESAISYPETVELINTVLRYLQKDEDRELVIVGSVEVLSKLSDEITAPGRFDMHIPVFPPSADERAQLIHYHLTKDLSEESPLLGILRANGAISPDFWQGVSGEMRLFSNTMLIDFTQTLKKRLYAIYRRKNEHEVRITPAILQACLNEAKAKLTGEYLTRCHFFIQEAKHNTALEFPHRFLELDFELDTYKEKEPTMPKIGFETSAERQKNGKS